MSFKNFLYILDLHIFVSSASFGFFKIWVRGKKDINGTSIVTRNMGNLSFSFGSHMYTVCVYVIPVASVNLLFVMHIYRV